MRLANITAAKQYFSASAIFSVIPPVVCRETSWMCQGNWTVRRWPLWTLRVQIPANQTCQKPSSVHTVLHRTCSYTFKLEASDMEIATNRYHPCTVTCLASLWWTTVCAFVCVCLCLMEIIVNCHDITTSPSVTRYPRALLHRRVHIDTPKVRQVMLGAGMSAFIARHRLV